MPRKKSPAAGPMVYVHQNSDAARAGEPRSAGRDHSWIETRQGNVPRPADLESVIAEIRYWHRQRCFAMEQRKRAYLALGAFLRTALGWSLNLPEGERKKIAKRAGEILKNPENSEWGAIVAAAKNSALPFERIEKISLDNMKLLASGLPVWSGFGEAIRGFGAGSLAVIVAEAGDLSNYATPSKLWKRMGLAVIDGVRQGGLPKGSRAEEWIAHGYSPQRRSRMWNIGDALIKSNQGGEYRSLYLARKQYETDRDPDIKPIKAHRRAQRYMEKRLLKKCWQAWRGACVQAKTFQRLPRATLSPQFAPAVPRLKSALILPPDPHPAPR